MILSYCLCLLTFGAQAQSISKDDYVDVEIWSGTTDAIDYEIESVSYHVAFSKSLANGFSLLAGYRHSDFDELTFIDSGPTQDAWNFGLGYRQDVLPKLEVFGNLRWLALESDFADESTTEYGLQSELGLFTAVTDSLGLSTSLRFVDVEDPIAQTSRELSVTAAARWQLSQRFSFAIGGEFGEYEDAWFGTIRYSLGDW